VGGTPPQHRGPTASPNGIFAECDDQTSGTKIYRLYVGFMLKTAHLPAFRQSIIDVDFYAFLKVF